MRVIVDTCVWSQFLRRPRRKGDPLDGEMEKLVRADALQMLGPIRQELLSGAQPQERTSSTADDSASVGRHSSITPPRSP